MKKPNSAVPLIAALGALLLMTVSHRAVMSERMKSAAMVTGCVLACSLLIRCATRE